MDEGLERAAARPAIRLWHVVAGPFTTAERLRSFLVTLAGLDGVAELVAERFRQGELDLRLRYAGGRPLAEALSGLAAFAARVEQTGDGTLRLVLAADDPAFGPPAQD